MVGSVAEKGFGGFRHGVGETRVSVAWVQRGVLLPRQFQQYGRLLLGRALCAAASQLFGDSVRTSITLIRAMMVPPESVWAACPLSSTAHEENRCAVMGYGRLICPGDQHAAQRHMP